MRLPIFFAKVARDLALGLDGQIGDAQPRVDLVRRVERAGRAGVETGAAVSAMVALRARRRGRSSVVKMLPRNSQEPNSRETRLVCLPCQPSPAAAASGFSITGAVSTKTLTSPSRPVFERATEGGRQQLQLALDDIVIIAMAGIDGDVSRRLLGQTRESVASRGRNSCRAG